MDKASTPLLPLHIARALRAVDKATQGTEQHARVLELADGLLYYLGALAIGQYSQAVVLEQINADPALNRSLRSLRRLLPGQWLGWTAKGLEATPNGVVEGLSEWYLHESMPELAKAYTELLSITVVDLTYTGDFGERTFVPPRALLELVDQYRIRRGKVSPEALPGDLDERVAGALLPGLRAAISRARFLEDYVLYAPAQRQLLMGVKAATPMPPMSAPADLLDAASILLYPQSSVPDFTKRPSGDEENRPLFPLDPLIVYIESKECDRFVMAALSGVGGGKPVYKGLDAECKGEIKQGE
jgi:hypothetical protein